VNAILFSKDGTTRTVENVSIDTYMDIPVYVAPGPFTKWHAEGRIPCGLQHTVDRVRYRKQIESEDYAVFVEE